MVALQLAGELRYTGLLVVGGAAAVAAAAALLAARRHLHRPRTCSAGPPRLEVCADSVAAAVAAEAGGAARIELCDSLLEGGTTPSVGKLLCCRRAVALPVHVMLRPRGGDFLYTAAELAVIEADLHALKAAGADGVVVGLLLDDGRVDEEKLRRIVRLAAPLPVTFHRAIDVTPDPVGGATCNISPSISPASPLYLPFVSPTSPLHPIPRWRRCTPARAAACTGCSPRAASRPRCRVPRRCAGWSTPWPPRTTRW